MNGRSILDLLAKYNRLVGEARDLGLDRYRTRTRFETEAAAQSYIDTITSAIRAHKRSLVEAGEGKGVPYPTQKEIKMAARKRGPEKDVPVTIGGLTEKYNALVPKAQKLGHTRHKHHTSKFGTLDHAQRMVAKIEADIASGEAE